MIAERGNTIGLHRQQGCGWCVAKGWMIKIRWLKRRELECHKRSPNVGSGSSYMKIRGKAAAHGVLRDTARVGKIDQIAGTTGLGANSAHTEAAKWLTPD